MYHGGHSARMHSCANAMIHHMYVLNYHGDEHADTMARVYACMMAIVYACTMAIVHACTTFMVRASTAVIAHGC